MINPLIIPAEAQDDQTDYQWIDTRSPGRENPGATGWRLVMRSEMPKQPSDDALFIKFGNLTLYKRPRVLTERVRAGEQAVAVEQRDNQMGGALVAKPLTSPRGPMPGKRTMRDLWFFGQVWLRRFFGMQDSQRLVEKWLRVNAVGLRRWSDENHVPVGQYVALHTGAILNGKGRWPGQIIRSVPRR